jgi:transposase-like protein
MIWRPEADLVGLEAGEADRMTWMDCVGCDSASVTERRELTVQDYQRFRCRGCSRHFNFCQLFHQIRRHFPRWQHVRDLVRAAFCLRKSSWAWKVAHQHISKPIQFGGG